MNFYCMPLPHTPREKGAICNGEGALSNGEDMRSIKHRGRSLPIYNCLVAVMGLMLAMSLALVGCDSDDVTNDTPDVVADAGTDATDADLTTTDSETLTCDDDYTLCDETCVDLNTDNANCGECGTVCPAFQTCEDGECIRSCPDGLTLCDDRCVDTTNTLNHCGDCNSPCEDGQICSDGECIFSCPPGQDVCNNECVSLDYHPNHCGQCNNPCGTNRVCEDGECILNCQTGFIDCNGRCVDTSVDTNNCGECGLACDTGEVCSNGSCGDLCVSPSQECEPGQCFNTQTSREHCGRCDNKCNPGQTCSGGECIVSCPIGQTNCDGNCVNLQDDPNNCGTCRGKCDYGEVCSSGQCLLDCPDHLRDCLGSCVDLQTDQYNCGFCGEVCQTGERCTDGECVVTCPRGQHLCDNECVTVDNNRRHCGECGYACPPGHDCEGGDCHIDCQGDEVACDELCVDLQTNNNHCGECDNPCPAGSECINGGCFIPTTSISLNNLRLNLELGDTSQLVATVLPEDATNKAVIWSSNKTNVATVNNDGLVTATGDGEAMITATTVSGNHSAPCLVMVGVPVTGVELAPKFVSLRPTQTASVQADVIPANASNNGVRWESSDNQVATVNFNGLITAIKSGEATITVTTLDGAYTDTCTVSVSDNPVTGITLDPTVITIIRDEVFQLNETVTPHDASNKRVTWYSSRGNIASVTQTGAITGLAEGVTTISAVTVDGGFSATCEVTVRVPVMGVSLNHRTLNLSRPAAEQLVATLNPLDVTDPRLVWTSSNPTVASVTPQGDGRANVTALKHGTTDITVTTFDGDFTDTCTVNVWVPLDGVQIHPPSIIVKLNETENLTAIFDPDDASNQTVVWNSDALEIATVENGVVTGHQPGTANITVVSDEGFHMDACVVTVSEPVTGVQLDQSSMRLNIDKTRKLTATISPDDATFKDLLWTSSDYNVADVDEYGNVYGINTGEATITVTTLDGGYTATCDVVVIVFDFIYHNFTTCGASGRSGPTVTQCRTEYSDTEWAANTAFFNVTSGIQLWTVPFTGTYRIQVSGAQGGSGTNGSISGGLGARMRGDFELEEGTKLKILVGQMGLGAVYGGGGGGTYVMREDNTPVIIAGGGGGAGQTGSYYQASKANGTTSTTARPGQRDSTASYDAGAGGVGGGTNDNGKYYNSSYSAGGGGGVNTNGQGYSSNHGISFKNGGTGGAGYSNGGYGGFGGGGGGTNYSCSTYCQGGGGGGYAGGGAGYIYGCGGGGASYNSGTNKQNQSGMNSGNGMVTITKID